mgnify:CR=1 FL=1
MIDDAGVALGVRDQQILREVDTVIGIDEVGRGALAGPVVVCAAAFNEIPVDPEVRDSKLVTPRKRERVAARLRESGVRWAACEVWPAVIDRINILEATRLAMAAVARALMTPRSAIITGMSKCRAAAVTGGHDSAGSRAMVMLCAAKKPITSA